MSSQADSGTSETLLTMATQYPTFMISEPAREAAAAESKNSKTELIGSSRLHAAFAESHKAEQRLSSDTLGSSVSDTTSYRGRSVFSSAASIESSTTVDSSSSTHGSDGKENDQDSLSLEATEPSQLETQPIPHDMFILRRSCRYNCHCTCHEETTDKPQRRFGSLKSHRKQCTDPVCLRYKVPPDESQRHSSLFRSALSRATSARVIQVRYDLQSFRMVPNGSNAVRYVNYGNLPKLKECIESGEATIWDTTLDGWSLLHVGTLAIEHSRLC